MLSLRMTKYIDGEVLFTIEEDLEKGIYIISGENGSGKTTLLNAVANIDLDYEGTICYNGINIKDQNPAMYRNQNICYLLQSPVLFNDLNCLENIELIIGEYNQEDLEQLSERLNFNKLLHSKKAIKKLSGGELQKLNIIINSLRDANIYLIDEVENNLDLAMIANIVEIVSKLEGIVLIVSHNQENFEQIANFELSVSNCQYQLLTRFENKFESESEKNSISNKNTLEQKNIKTLGKLNLYNRVLFGLILAVTFITLSLFVSNIGFISGFITRPAATFENNAMIITPPYNSQLYNAFGNQEYTAKIPYNFREQEYDLLRNIEGVEKLYPIAQVSKGVMSGSLQRADGIYMYEGTINLEDLNYEKYGFEEYRNFSEFIDVNVSNLLYPSDIGNNTPYPPGVSVDELVYGTYPEDNTNQVIIDIYYAMELATLSSKGDIKDLVGTEFELPFTNVEGRETENFKFEISGIYIPKGDMYESTIYYSYTPEAEIVKRNNPSLFTDKSDEMYNVTMASDADLNVTVKLTDEQLSQIGDYPAFYLEVSDEETEEQIFDMVKAYDPYIDIDSNYARTQLTSFVYMRKYVFKTILFFVVILGLFILTVLGLKKLIKIELEKMKKVFDHFGFANTELAKVEKHELQLLTTLTILIVISYVLYTTLKYGVDLIYIISYVIIELLVVSILNKAFRKGK